MYCVRPSHDRGQLDVEHDRNESRALPTPPLRGCSEKFQLVLEIFWREQRAIVEAPDIAHTVDDLELPFFGSKNPASPVFT
jgi:hypothetical protein